MTLFPSEWVLVATCAVLLLVLLAQIWATHEADEMKIVIENGRLYADGLQLCFVEVGNGCTDFEPGRWPATVQYSPQHDGELVRAEGFGWLGAHHECDAILGHVRGRTNLIPDLVDQKHLVRMVIDALDDGRSVTLEIAP